MKFSSTITAVLGLAATASVLSAPIQEVSTNAIAERNINERTLFPWCLNVLGLVKLGNCGCWSRPNFEQYKKQCISYGWPYKAVSVSGGLQYQWNTQLILDTHWASFGKFWLPKDCSRWGFETPSPFRPTPSCPQKWLDGYHKACKKIVQHPRYYWDEHKQGYWFFWKGAFVFQLDLTLTASGYCVPKHESIKW